MTATDTSLLAAAWRTLCCTPLLTQLPLHDTSAGIGRLVIKGGHELQPRIIAHEENISAGQTLSRAAIEWLSGEIILARQEISFETSVDRPALLREKNIAAAEVDLAINEGWCLNLPDDLAPGRRRRITNERGKTVEIRPGTPTTLALGHAVRIDDSLVYEADRELHFQSTGQPFSPPGFDRIIAKAGIGQYAIGDTIREGLLRITVLGE